MVQTRFEAAEAAGSRAGKMSARELLGPRGEGWPRPSGGGAAAARDVAGPCPRAAAH